MKGLTNYNNKIDFNFYGIAGPKMLDLGIKNVFDFNQLNLIGFLGPLLKIFILSKRLDEIVDYIVKLKPNLIITVDSKLFSLNLAKRLKKRFYKENLNIPIVHIVLPTIWAYSPNRALKWKNVFDRLYSVIPNEKKYFDKFNINTKYCGNPVFENLIKKKSKIKIIKNKNICLLLPGSRKKEIKYNLRIIIKSVKLINKKFTDIIWVLPTLEKFRENIFKEIKNNGLEKKIKLVNFNKQFKTIVSSKVAIACSGTVTMELALAGIPTIGIYKTDFISGLIGKYLVNMSNVILPNFISGKSMIPFLFQEKCTSKNILSKFEMFYKNNKRYKNIFEKFSNELVTKMKYNPINIENNFQKKITADILDLISK